MTICLYKWPISDKIGKSIAEGEVSYGDIELGRGNCGEGGFCGKRGTKGGRSAFGELYLDKREVDMTVQNYLNEWLTEQNGSVKQKTFARYAEIVKNNIAPAIGGVELNDLTSKQVRAFVTKLGEDHADNTILQIVGVLKRALACATQEDIINRNPAQGIVLKRRQQKVEPLTEIEQRAIEKYIFNTRRPYYYGILIALYTGVRIGELLALTWRDVDMKSRTITVSKTAGTLKVCDGPNPYISSPKTEAGKRTIPYPKQLQPLFKELKNLGNEYVVSTRGGNFMTVYGYQKAFARLLERLGLRHKGFHSLRHTYATRAIEAGADIKTLSEMLGHSSPTVTITRYCHSTDKQKNKICEKIGDNLKRYDICHN